MRCCLHGATDSLKESQEQNQNVVCAVEFGRATAHTTILLVVLLLLYATPSTDLRNGTGSNDEDVRSDFSVCWCNECNVDVRCTPVCLISLTRCCLLLQTHQRTGHGLDDAHDGSGNGEGAQQRVGSTNDVADRAYTTGGPDRGNDKRYDGRRDERR